MERCSWEARYRNGEVWCVSAGKLEVMIVSQAKIGGLSVQMKS